jgi:hypothetical protein
MEVMEEKSLLEQILKVERNIDSVNDKIDAVEKLIEETEKNVLVGVNLLFWESKLEQLRNLKNDFLCSSLFLYLSSSKSASVAII